MKNVILKHSYYKDFGFFNHIYCLDIDYNFNEKSVEEIIDFVKSEPFFDVLIHTNDLNIEIIHIIKEVSKYKNIWLESQFFLFEDFAVMNDETKKILGIDKINVMIDALDDVIDVKRTLEDEILVKFNYMDVPF